MAALCAMDPVEGASCRLTPSLLAGAGPALGAGLTSEGCVGVTLVTLQGQDDGDGRGVAGGMAGGRTRLRS